MAGLSIIHLGIDMDYLSPIYFDDRVRQANLNGIPYLLAEPNAPAAKNLDRAAGRLLLQPRELQNRAEESDVDPNEVIGLDEVSYSNVYVPPPAEPKETLSVHEESQRDGTEDNAHDPSVPVRLAVETRGFPLQRLQGTLDFGQEVSQSFATLLSSLKLQLSEKPLRSLLVASAQPEEGKTTVTIGLALTMLKAGRRVVIVDADVRRPSIHKHVGLENSLGLVDVLRGDASPEEVLQRAEGLEASNGGGSLSVIPSGSVTSFNVDWAPRMKEILDHLMNMADVVLVDSPPALAVSDALLMASMVDGVLLVLNTGDVSAENAKRAKERLLEAGGRIIGFRQ